MEKIFVGIDVAKQTHWACAMDAGGRIVLDRAVENDPEAIEGFVAELHALEGEAVIGLDVVGSVARFLEAMLLGEGFALVHTPGIAVNRAGQGFAGGERKSDPGDARTIADLVRTRPLRPVLPDDDTLVALRLKVARRRELVAEQTRRLCRLRQLLGGIHPGLERALDVTCKGPLALLARHVTPAEIRRAGRKRLIAHLRKTPHLRGVEALADAALAAAAAQRIVVPGEAATAEMIREMAVEALETRARLARLDRDLEALLERHPDGALIQSLPGVGAILAAELLAHLGNIARFPSADALASTAGLAPVLRQSGKARGWRRARGGDKALKRIFFQSAFCAVRAGDPLSKAYYDRKRREGKTHTQALIALARRRVTVLWTMLRNHEAFDRDRKAA
ncbi:MAG TPA: IS110 family transposase [Amaricoccus sp.]|uniref:IS110 family transposase n=1 Tax=Amaricoccus sp. TaxID=1872485 RepID=UPI002C4DD189|nr:IS110 family transposase [Amaricoccus sp.]HMQ95097.1 IS110 family transposase [Amaricoccus sp.]HMR51269.1 IS110 family transposase [Amaricoccus sp.]HMR60062.1 IS110 family transposase [Amaricoccus sp.]HMT97981.1 IS110 family transposase [Amaricoccus sp.]